MRVEEIYPAEHQHQLSFYGKAVEVYDDTGVTLFSYNTPVARISWECADARVFVRLWSGWSATTAKHINAFCAKHFMPGYTKRKWEALPVAEI